MLEELEADDHWPLPTGRDELLRRVVAEGQRKVRTSRLLLAGATVVVMAGLGVGLVGAGDDPAGDDRAGLEHPVASEPATGGRPSPAGPAAGPRPSEQPPVAADVGRSDPADPLAPTSEAPSADPTPTTSGAPPLPASSSAPARLDPAPVPGTFDPVPPDEPVTEPPTRPTPPTRPAEPPAATVGPISRSADAIVPEPTRGGGACTGPTTSTITAPVDNATSATLSWRVGTESGNKPMAIEGGAASATLGPFDKEAIDPAPGPTTVDVTVIVVGDRSLASSQGAVTLIDCPRR